MRIIILRQAGNNNLTVSFINGSTDISRHNSGAFAEVCIIISNKFRLTV